MIWGKFALAFIVALLAVPTSASASELIAFFTHLSPGMQVGYKDTTGETNALKVTPELVVSKRAYGVSFSDPGAAAIQNTAPLECPVATPTLSLCQPARDSVPPRAGNRCPFVLSFSAELGGGDDTMTVTGPYAWMRLYVDPGAGRDQVAGGTSDDRLMLQDGERDVVTACGVGYDIVDADTIDQVAGDCEAVDRG